MLESRTVSKNGSIYSRVEHKELYISKEAWKDLNTNLNPSEIKQLLIDTIINNKIELPLEDISLADAERDFQNLKDLNGLSLLKTGDLYSRYDYKYKLSNTYIGASNIGNKSSNHFHQYNRWLCDSINSPSPYRTWTTPKFLDTLLNCLWTLKFDHISMEVLRSAIALRKYIASQFRPSAAKAIYELYNSKDVLDFSSGWGDRLNGFLSCENTESYLGLDPNERLVEGYAKQESLYNSGKKVEMICTPAETFDFIGRSFDTIFTSPPYFNIEKYTQESNQSYKRYRKLDNWLNEFLFKVIGNSWKCLRSGGHLIINISDVYSNHTINKICDPMNDYISTLEGAICKDALGLRMAKRPNSNAVKQDGVFVEPIWVWEKK